MQFTQFFYDFKELEVVLVGAVVHHGEGSILELPAAEEAKAGRPRLGHLLPIAASAFFAALLLLLLRHWPKVQRLMGWEVKYAHFVGSKGQKNVGVVVSCDLINYCLVSTKTKTSQKPRLWCSGGSRSESACGSVSLRSIHHGYHL